MHLVAIRCICSFTQNNSSFKQQASFSNVKHAEQKHKHYGIQVTYRHLKLKATQKDFYYVVLLPLMFIDSVNNNHDLGNITM